MLYCPNFFWNVLQVWMTGKDVYLQMTWSWPDKTWNILCSYCLKWNTSQSKFRNHYFLFLFAFSILSQLFLIWGCIYIYILYIYVMIIKLGVPRSLTSALAKQNTWLEYYQTTVDMQFWRAVWEANSLLQHLWSNWQMFLDNIRLETIQKLYEIYSKKAGSSVKGKWW